MYLQRPDVVAKACEILDTYGLADLTMRRLARELGVTPGALYWHFADKQELLGAVADRLLAPVTVPGDENYASDDWPVRLITICTALRGALLSSTDGAELVSATFAAGRSPALQSIADALAAVAAESGLPDTEAQLAARTVIYYVLGFTVDEQSRLQWDAAGAGLPHARTTECTSRDSVDRFVFGLQLFIGGLTAHTAITR